MSTQETINVYVFPAGLFSHGRKVPMFVWMESIYKGRPRALLSTRDIQMEEGTINLFGDTEISRHTEWGTRCGWCEKRYYLDNMLIIVDDNWHEKSIMCPSCYREIVENKKTAQF